MLVHDIRKNESRIIDFRETAPSGLREDMLQDLQQKVNTSAESYLKGLVVLWAPLTLWIIKAEPKWETVWSM